MLIIFRKPDRTIWCNEHQIHLELHKADCSVTRQIALAGRSSRSMMTWATRLQDTVRNDHMSLRAVLSTFFQHSLMMRRPQDYTRARREMASSASPRGRALPRKLHAIWFM